MRLILTIAVLLFAVMVAFAQKPDSTAKKESVKYTSYGFTDAASIGLFVPFEDNLGFAVENSVGYRFNPYFSLCAAASLDVTSDVIMVPVSLNPRFDLGSGKFSNYVNGSIGYLITVNDTYRGMFLGFELGHKYYLAINRALLFALEFRYFAVPNSGGVFFKTGFQF